MRILAFLFLATLCAEAQLNVSNARYVAGLLAPAAAGGGGTPPASPLVNETFEGAGYSEGATWTSDGGGTVDPDYTSVVIAGSHSLRLLPAAPAGVSRIYKSFTSGNERWAYFRFRGVATVGELSIFDFWDSGFGVPCRVTLKADNTLTISHGTVTSSATVGTMANDVDYHVWVTYNNTANTGSVGFSTTGTRPTSGNNFTSVSGDGSTDASRVVIGLDATDFLEEAIYDTVYVDDEQILDQ